jgi:anti-sigma B factor antagonist
VKLDIAQATDGDRRTTVTATGEIDLATSPQLASALFHAIDEGAAEVVLDLYGVDFLDSAGIGTLVEVARIAAEGDVSLTLQGARGWVERVLQITGLAGYLPMTPAPPVDGTDR